MQYRVTIPNKHLKLLDDDQYVHLSTVPSFSAALFGVYKNHIAAVADARNRPVSKTDIIQQLIDLRNSNIDTMMAAIAGGVVATRGIGSVAMAAAAPGNGAVALPLSCVRQDKVVLRVLACGTSDQNKRTSVLHPVRRAALHVIR